MVIRVYNVHNAGVFDFGYWSASTGLRCFLVYEASKNLFRANGSSGVELSDLGCRKPQDVADSPHPHQNLGMV